MKDYLAPAGNTWGKNECKMVEAGQKENEIH